MIQVERQEVGEGGEMGGEEGEVESGTREGVEFGPP